MYVQLRLFWWNWEKNINKDHYTNKIALRENGANLDGATEHTLTCHGHFNWIHPKTVVRENDYRKRKIREALETKKAKYNKKIKVLNRIEGNLVKTNTWTLQLANINEI